MRRIARFLSLGLGAAVVFGLSKIHARYIAEEAYDFTASFRLTWAIAYIGLLAVATYAVGLPEQPRSWRQALLSAGMSAGLAALGVSAVQLVVGDALLPRMVVFGTALAVVPCQVTVWALARGGRVRGEERDRVLLVGAAGERDHLTDELRVDPERAASITAWLSPDEARVDGSGRRPLIEAQSDARATVLVIDNDAQGDESVIGQAARLHESGVRVRTLEAFYEEWLGKLPLSELERASLFFDIGEIHRARYVRSKRLVDLVLGAAGLIPLLVVVPVVLVGNLVGNRGPLLYRQIRIGKGGEEFTILKFRTMRDDDSVPTQWTALGDPRVTRFGRLLRSSHLDELPQVLNILRGDLAVVGPRPEQPHYVDELSAKLDFYELRHLVRPGLTGWAQVKYGYAGDERDALEKLQYEFFYLRHQNLVFDLRIIGRTVRSIAGGPGRGR